MTNSFIFSAITFPVFGWTKNLLTKQTILFWFESSIVYGFGFFHFSTRPFTDLLGRRQTNLHSSKIINIYQGFFPLFLFFLSSLEIDPQSRYIIISIFHLLNRNFFPSGIKYFNIKTQTLQFFYQYLK